MAKKYEHLFERVSDFKNLRRAFYSASKGKMDRHSIPKILQNPAAMSVANIIGGWAAPHKAPRLF